QRDDSWFILASNELGVPESVVREYAKEGDSLSLAILIHIARRQLTHYRISCSLVTRFSEVLNAASKFDAKNTLPELQREFCALWCQIVLKARNNNDRTITWKVLAPIRSIYLALHQGTDAAPTRFSETTGDQDRILSNPKSYPLCDVFGHPSDSTPHIHDVSSSTTLACATPPHKDAALAPTSPASPDTPSSFEPAPPRVDESPRVPVTSDITVPDPAPETSPSTPPLPPTSGPVSPQDNADPPTASNAPSLSSSASSNPVLDNILPTGLILSSNSPMTRSGPSPSHPESYLSVKITTAPPGPTSTPDLGVAAEGDGSAKPGLRRKGILLTPPRFDGVCNEYWLLGPLVDVEHLAESKLWSNFKMGGNVVAGRHTRRKLPGGAGLVSKVDIGVWSGERRCEIENGRPGPSSTAASYHTLNNRGPTAILSPVVVLFRIKSDRDVAIASSATSCAAHDATSSERTCVRLQR
ncbi:hypothetical protein EDB92DRAFT_2001702, partial [Lactarius akahatsu]